MKWRSGLTAVIGIWFIIAPWALHFSGSTAAVWASVILGAIQFVTSLWTAFVGAPAGWKQWQPWVSIITGAWFIVQPFVLSLGGAETWSSVILGIITIVLHAWIMSGDDPAEQSKHSNKAHA